MIAFATTMPCDLKDRRVSNVNLQDNWAFLCVYYILWPPTYKAMHLLRVFRLPILSLFGRLLHDYTSRRWVVYLQSSLHI